MIISKDSIITESVLQQGLAIFLDYRKTIIIPNVSYGWQLKHEADLIYIRNRSATEIEIKTTRTDFLNDFNKKHGHENKKINRLVYCIPKDLQQLAEKTLNSKIGIVCFERILYTYSNKHDKLVFTKIRQGSFKTPKHILTDQEIIAIMRLGCMRQWNKHNVTF